MKKLLAAILLGCMLLLLCGCGAKSEDFFVGTWKGSYTFNDKEFTVTLVINADGSFSKDYYINGSYASTEVGVYTIDNGDLLLDADNDEAFTRYKVQNGKIVNNNHPLTKVK